MTQNDLNRAVADATGETVSEIAHRGFQALLSDTVDPLLADDQSAPYGLYQRQTSPTEPVAA